MSISIIRAQACKVRLLQIKKSSLLKIWRIYPFTSLANSGPRPSNRHSTSSLASSTSAPPYAFCSTSGNTPTITYLTRRTKPISLSFCRQAIKLKLRRLATATATNRTNSPARYPSPSPAHHAVLPYSRFALSCTREEGRGKREEMRSCVEAYTLSFPQIR